MTTTRPSFVRFLTFAAVMGLAALAAAPTAGLAQTIKIGELTSYNNFAAFNVPYRNGWQMALDEINEAGGVMGETLEIVSRDDGATTGDAVRVAEELVTRDKVAFIFGTFLSNVGLAVGDFANQNKVLFMATEPLTDALTLDQGNRYTFRIRPNTYMQTSMLVDAVRESGAKRWAIVAPNYEYGQSSAENFKRFAAEVIPGAEIVAEQYPALGKIDAGATVAALQQANPDGIFCVLFGGDLAKFVREGNVRGLFEGKTVASLLTGEPEWMLSLGDEVPEGWIVTGYPWDQIDFPEHKAFVDKYQARYNETPRLGSLLGYIVVHVLKQAIEQAGTTETEKLIDTLEGMTAQTVIGPITIRASDHQSTMGAWVGKLTVREGKGTMTDWKFLDGADYMTPEEEVEARRPQ
ncbi:MAG: ABC transporter substrate-binding protein [Hyphomicrobiales bacterium]|nr:ABC transporter substrate-binding protein [Hyphomicrobiales bacterium]